MPKLNVYSLKRPGTITETKTFTDPLQPGQELTLTLLASPSQNARARARQIAGEYVEKFVDGNAQYVSSGGKEGEPPAPVMSGGSGQIAVTEYLCRVVGTLMQMQEAYTETLSETAKLASADDQYDVFELMILSETMPNAFEDAVGWASGLIQRAEGKTTFDPAKNSASRSPNTMDGSGSPSTDAVATTPK